MRKVLSPELGWLVAPDFGEAGRIRLARADELSDAELEQSPLAPGNPPEPDPDDPPGPPPPIDDPLDAAAELEQHAPWPGPFERDAWEDVAEADEQIWQWRDLYDPLELEPYIEEGRCTVPPAHPNPGTIIATVADHGRRAWGDWQSDHALDIWAYPGTAVTACAAGVVSTSYGYGLRGSDPAGNPAGWRLHVEHGSGMISFYTHMESLAVRRGTRVARGAVLGWSGFANCVPHLHFAVTPPFRPEAFYRMALNLNRRRGRPAPPEPVPLPPRSPLRRTPDEAWLNLMRAVGPDRRVDRRRVQAAQRRLRDAVS